RDARRRCGMLSLSRRMTNGSGRSPSRPSAQLARIAALTAVTATLLVPLTTGYWLLSDDEKREVRDLPVPQRQALYHRTRENLQTLCDPAAGRSVVEFCRNQASLALKFSECEDDCRRTARRHLSLPRP